MPRKALLAIAIARIGKAIASLDAQEVKRSETLHVAARLADGSNILLKGDFSIKGGVLSGQTPGGLALRVPVAQLAALGFMGGSFIHVSDLQPIKVERFKVGTMLREDRALVKFFKWAHQFPVANPSAQYE